MQKTQDPDLADTTTSPSTQVVRDMQVDPGARKRAALELEAVEKQKDATPATLVLTQGLGEDGGENTSPTNSSNSKRAKISSQKVSGEESAASLEEDRRTQ